MLIGGINLPQNSSLKINAALNVIKQCCTIIFPLITFPYIYRVLGSDGFGKYSFSMSVCTYFILLAGLGINTYAIREGSKIRDNKIKLSQLSNELLSINILSSIVSYLLLLFVLIFNEKVFNYRLYIIILSLSISFITLGTDWINSIFEDYFYITIRYIIIQIIALVLMFVFVRNSNDVYKYCLIVLFASYGGNLFNIFYVRKYVKIRPTLNINIKKHIKPLLILFAGALAVTIYVTADITMLGFYYDDSEVGKYSFASKIYSIIKQLINAIVIVAIPRLAYLHANKNSSKEYINKLFSAISCLTFPICAGLFCLSDTVLVIAGGSECLDASNSLKILSFSIVFALYASVISNCILVVNNMEKEFLISTIISAVINISLNLFVLPILGILGAAITTLISELVNLIAQYLYARKRVDIQVNLKNIFIYIMGSFVIVIICCVFSYAIESYYLRFILAFSISVCSYFLILVLFKDELCLSVIKFANKVFHKLIR